MNTAIALDTSSETFNAQLELRHALVCAWRADPKQDAAAHAAYAMIRGKSLNKTFTPISNPNKLASNGSNPNQGRDGAVEAARQGSRHAWKWAESILKEAGIASDRYGRYSLDAHPIIGEWIRASLAEIQ